MAFSAGGIVLASQLNNLLTPGWTSYTPVWTAATTNPVLNNGSLTGRYRRSTGSDRVYVECRLTMGSTTTYGTGGYWITVPVNASVTSTANAVGTVFILDSGTLTRIGVCVFSDATKLAFVSSAGGDISPTVPQTWANGDQMRWTIEYEPA